MSDDARVLRVAIDNDFPVVVAGLGAMLSGHRDRIEVVELGPDLLQEADIVLKDTFGLTHDLAGYVLRTPARVVVFAAADDQQAIDRAFERGVSGFVHKSVTVDGLVKALERVCAGERVVIRRAEVGSRGPGRSLGTVDWPGKGDGLSDRESEVLTLICQGLSNQQVADALYLSVNSVKTYIRTLYRKIGAQSRSQAVIWGLQRGFSTDGTVSGR